MGRAGYDPVVVGTPAVQKTYAPAIKFDIQSRSFPQDSSGRQIPIDPVDQKVSMLIGIEFGTVASAPSQFNKLRGLLSRLPAARKPTVARQEIDRVLKLMIDAGDITINFVSVDTIASGTDQVGLNYTNLRTNTTPPTMPVL